MSNATVSPLNSGDTAWVTVSSVLVFIQIPALAFFYSGLVETKNALSVLLSVMLCASVVVFQWIFIGYTLSFSDSTESVFIGNFAYVALRDSMTTENALAPTIPNALLAMYQMMFACITPGLFIGAVAGRLRMLPMMIFVLIWTTIVYDPIAYWNWSAHGWLHSLSCMDYAGGSVVHVSSGVTGLVLAIMLGKRVDYGTRTYQPHNPTFVYLGTALIWFGWNGFNGGSALASNERAVAAAFSTNIAAALGGLTFMAMDSLVNKKKFSALSYCNGVIVGLVAITPGSGFVQPVMGIVFGVLPAIACFYAMKFMHYLKIDDCLEVSACHGVGGAFGMILTGLLAQYEITRLNAGEGAPAGWIDGNWIQMPVQLAGIFSVVVWTAAWTAIIVYLMNLVPGLRLRCDVESELAGLDVSEVGEVAYPYAHVLDSECIEVGSKSAPVRIGGLPESVHGSQSTISGGIA
ncbi:ammonium transporter AmtB-like domain-containing protein [Obelidium mucronatum]|nr:ammonium transporter AmtB-like domain-containing protein [Obelidium mucronatum]